MKGERLSVFLRDANERLPCGRSLTRSPLSKAQQVARLRPMPILNAAAIVPVNGLGEPVKQAHCLLRTLLHECQAASDHGIPPTMCHFHPLALAIAAPAVPPPICDGFLLSTHADISVIKRPTGNASIIEKTSRRK